jgi:hypothetical protein
MGGDMQTTRTRLEALHDKRNAVNAAEESGLVADSMEVRIRLLRRMNSGEITLIQVQAELKKIKRDAKKNGMTTRSKTFSQG